MTSAPHSIWTFSGPQPTSLESQISHHIEHIVAKQHGGTDELANLALACHRCNLRKGPNLTGIDPLTGEVAPLFHPRLDRWSDRFRFENVQVEGKTATGRATVQVLALNDARRLDLRMELLIRGGLHSVNELSAANSAPLRAGSPFIPAGNPDQSLEFPEQLGAPG